MTPAWAQRQEELLRDCIVSPGVFNSMVDHLCDFVMPYQHALETEANPHSMHLYLQGLLSHLPRKNAEAIAVWVDVERQVLQDFIGIAPWDHRPLIRVLVGQVAQRLGAPDGIIAFDPSRFPTRGTPWPCTCTLRLITTGLPGRPSQEQKGRDERARMASQRPSESW